MTLVLRLVVSNTAAQLIAKFVGAGLTLLTTYYTIRLGGLELYGDLTKIMVLVAVGFTTIDFGLNAEVVRVGTTPSKLKSVLSQTYSARIILSLFAIIILNLLIYLLPGGYSADVKRIFFLGSLAIIFQGLYTSGNAYFQSKLSYWRSAVSVIVGSLIGTIITFYFLYTRPTLFGLVFANTLGYLFMAIVSFFMIPFSPPFSINFHSAASTLKNSLYLGLILLASVIASKIDTIILGVYQSSSVVGQYGFAYRIFEVILTLPTFVMNALFPLMVRGTPKLLKNTLISLGLLGFLAGILLWLMAPLVAFVKPGELSGTIISLKILALSLPLFYTTAPLMWQLLSFRRDKLVLVIYLLGATLNATLNYFFVPHFGLVAAAATTGVTELFLFLSLSYYVLYYVIKKR